jgi:hypothetical protein
MGERNRHGLSRHIPAEVKREVRVRCGFGCVRCGVAFFDYEHFVPDFKDATSHLAEGITLLCMQCNQKRARGTLSVETVAAANLAPKCHTVGFAREQLDFGRGPVEVVIGGASFIDCRTLIELNGTPMLSLAPPEEVGSPWRLSGSFADETGANTLVIRNNEWAVGAHNWDVECVGQLITVRSGPGQVVLRLRQLPPSKLVVEQLLMDFQGIKVRCGGGVLNLSMDGVRISSNRISGSTFMGCGVGIKLENRRERYSTHIHRFGS